MAKTTVVIPNYNGRNYLDECLSSLYKGTLVPEIIVVDNGSADGSVRLVEEKYPKAKLITFTENTGFCKAVNAGIKAASTEYVLLLNNDTVSDAHMTSYMEKAIEGDEKIFSAGAKMLNLREPDKLDGAGDFYCALGWAYARGKDKAADTYQNSCRIFSACGGAAIYRRKVFEEIGYFDENHFAYLEDVDIGYRANIYGYHNRYVPEAVVYHAGSAVSGSRHNDFKVKLSARNSIYLICKNMPFIQILLNLPFLFAGYFVKMLFFTLKGMGDAYFKGLLGGIKLYFSAGRKNKVRFSLKNLKNYFWIQGQLWINIVRR